MLLLTVLEAVYKSKETDLISTAAAFELPNVSPLKASNLLLAC